MAWIFDEYSKYKGFSPAVVTGKPLHLHGSLGREQAGGRGVLFAAREFLRDALCARVQGSSFVIQGFGKLGASAARHLHDAGGKVVAVADARSAVHNERGLDVPALQAHAARGGMLSDFEGGGAVMADPVSFLSMPCDVLIPAAIGGVLTAGTAAKVQARAVIEAANAACTPEGDAVVRARRAGGKEGGGAVARRMVVFGCLCLVLCIVWRARVRSRSCSLFRANNPARRCAPPPPSLTQSPLALLSCRKTTNQTKPPNKAPRPRHPRTARPLLQRRRRRRVVCRVVSVGSSDPL